MKFVDVGSWGSYLDIFENLSSKLFSSINWEFLYYLEDRAKYITAGDTETLPSPLTGGPGSHKQKQWIKCKYTKNEGTPRTSPASRTGANPRPDLIHQETTAHPERGRQPRSRMELGVAETR